MRIWYRIALVFTISVGEAFGAQSWSTPAVFNDVSPSGANADILLSYDSATGQTFAAWSDLNNSYYPTYSIYDPTMQTWSTPAVFSNTSPSIIYDNISLSYDSTTDQTFAAWADPGNSHYPTYSIYDPTMHTWSTPTVFSNTSSSEIVDDVLLSYDSATGQTFAAWGDPNNNNYPTYSIYDPTMHTWSTPAVFSNTSPSTVPDDVFLSYGSATGQTFAAWGDSNNNNYPTYSIYDPTMHTWSTPAVFSNTSPSVAYNNVSLSYNSATGQTFAAWADNNNNSYPTYSIYDPTIPAWSTPAVFSDASPSEILENVYLSYDSATGQTFAAWADSNNNNYPTYSIYDPTIPAWSTPAVFSGASSSAVDGDVFLSYDSATGQTFAAWGDSNNAYYPTYSIYSGSTPSPPTNGHGQKVKNQFPFEVEWFNLLSWTASTSSSVVGYNVTRNAVLIANNIALLTYKDVNRPQYGADVYTITGIDASGDEITQPLIIEIN